MRLLVATLVGKFIAFLSQNFKVGGGSAAPGLYALKFEPDLISKLASFVPKNVIITGTNGKTTTARLLAHLAMKDGLKVIRNSTGSNLERGIASELVRKISWFNRGSKYNLGIWELDEAAFNSVGPKLKPDVVIFLNAFRDQLDRYGEVDSVVKKWEATLEKLPKETVLLVNGDDANTLKLKKYSKGEVLTFGVDGQKIGGEQQVKSHQSLDFKAKEIKNLGLEGSEFKFVFKDNQITVNLPIPGIYHVYDAVAALSLGKLFNLPIHQLVQKLDDFRPAFGRVEKLPFGYILLIKNPTGATQVLQTIVPQFKENDRLLVALNDNFADGTDVSWIWDAEFEEILKSKHKLQAFCAGTRAYDMAVRLKYAGLDSNILQVEQELKQALKAARKGLKGQLYVLPTYTALLELQKILTNEGIKQHYWRE